MIFDDLEPEQIAVLRADTERALANILGVTAHVLGLDSVMVTAQRDNGEDTDKYWVFACSPGHMEDAEDIKMDMLADTVESVMSDVQPSSYYGVGSKDGDPG